MLATTYSAISVFFAEDPREVHASILAREDVEFEEKHARLSEHLHDTFITNYGIVHIEDDRFAIYLNIEYFGNVLINRRLRDIVKAVVQQYGYHLDGTTSTFLETTQRGSIMCMLRKLNY